MQKMNLERWISDNFQNTVYISGPNSFNNLPPSRSLEIIEKTLPNLESNLIEVNNENADTANKIIEILTHRDVRKGSRSLIESYLPQIKEKLERLISNDQTISFVLPTLPFKDQSPLTTGLKIDAVDLGEYAFFAQLRRVSNSISKVYKPGAHFTLLCDGYIYADIFANGDIDGAGRYKASCEKIKNQYGLYNEITLFDMREVIFDMPEWNNERRRIEQRVRELSLNEKPIKDRIMALSDQMIFHTFLSYSYDDLVHILKSNKKDKDLEESLYEAAIKYISIVLALKYTDIVYDAFPSAVRCTVHPKKAPQIPLSLTNRDNLLLPYNGVATISREKIKNNNSFFRTLRTKRLVDVYSLNDVVAVHNERNGDFLYYEVP
jgi:pyoverdine/dityrosine biosynthesis protein Dit1